MLAEERDKNTRQGQLSFGELLGPPSLSFFLIDVSALVNTWLLHESMNNIAIS